MSKEEELYLLIEKHVPELPTNNVLSEGLRVYHDLGLWGDDIDDFFKEYSDRFNVNIDKVNFNLYFPEEGYSIVNFWKLFKKKKKFKEMTISDLIRGIKTGVLAP